MREAYIKGIDREFSYSFGADLDVIVAIMHYPGKNLSKCYLVSERELSGEALIAFINEHAPSARHIIPEIDPVGRYSLIAVDD